VSAPEILHVVYDGQCAFCIRALRVSRALDCRGALRFHDSHDAAIVSRFPMLRNADLDEAMYVVAESGGVYRGFFGFRRMAWSSPFTWPLLPLLYAPGAGYVGPKVYGWIARHRGEFGCRTGVCEAPASLPASAPRGGRSGVCDADRG
jgi:predicted DCC family thiol-disulfide oxidoreductase YuxK